MAKKMSITLLILGIVFYATGSFLSFEALQGQSAVAAQESSGGRRTPVVGPVRKAVAANAAQNKQEQIGQAESVIAGHQTTSFWLHAIGGILFVIGAGGMIYFSMKKHKK